MSDAENLDSDLLPDLHGIASQLRLEAQDLAERYPSTRLMPLSSGHEPEASDSKAGLRLAWSCLAIVPAVILLAAGWLALGLFDDDDQLVAPPAAVANSSDNPTAELRAGEIMNDGRGTIPHLRRVSVGLHDISGPELEAVLNLLEDNSTTSKLAL